VVEGIGSSWIPNPALALRLASLEYGSVGINGILSRELTEIGRGGGMVEIIWGDDGDENNSEDIWSRTEAREVTERQRAKRGS
jgi:hypothetical protein